MKKIMFSDAFCLTKAVLDGTKTMTRRNLTLTLDKDVDGKLIRVYPSKVFFDNGKWLFGYDGKTYFLPKENYPAYKVGEVVAVAQSYNAVGRPQYDKFGREEAGNTNKMFVKSDLLPHHIKITDVKVERLQSITDDDIMREGIYRFGKSVYAFERKAEGYLSMFPTAREAFASLIDKISGNGTWESDPWVVAYGFELVD